MPWIRVCTGHPRAGGRTPSPRDFKAHLPNCTTEGNPPSGMTRNPQPVDRRCGMSLQGTGPGARGDQGRHFSGEDVLPLRGPTFLQRALLSLKLKVTLLILFSVCV